MNNQLPYLVFDVHSYRGDQYSETYDDIVNASGERWITQAINTDNIYAIPLDKIVVTLSDVINAPLYEKYSNTAVLWDFGDGTLSTELSAVHWYKFPGTYTIRLTAFDKNLMPIKSSYENVINVYSYIPNELPINSDNRFSYTYGDIIKFEPLNLVDSALISSYDTGIQHISQLYDPNGTELWYFSDPYLKFNLHKFNNWYSYDAVKEVGYNIQLYAENTSAPFTSQLEYNSNAYSHLSSTSKFIDNGSIVDTVHFDAIGSEIYITYDRNRDQFVQCDKNTNNAFMVGTYSCKQLMFSDDGIGDNINLIATFNTDGFKTHDNIFNTSHQQLVNHVPTVFTFSINLTGIENDIVSKSMITASGLSGMNIYEYKFVNEPIPFVYNIGFNVDGNFTPFKCLSHNFVLDDEGNITYNNQPVGNICVTSNDSVISGVRFEPVEGSYGCINSCVYIPIVATNCIINVSIVSAIDTYTIEDYPNYKSNTIYPYFNVLENKQRLQIFKKNEDFDLSNVYNSLRLQPILQESDNFFSNILNQIVGDASSYNNLGVQLYEKISNFILNTADVDTCNVSYLYDIYNKLDEYIIDLNYTWPVELQRLVDLFSIALNKLKGQKNKFDSDFDKHGYTNNSNYGINLGEQINFNTDMVDIDEYIVAYEKFSKKYIKLSCRSYLKNTSLSKCPIKNFMDTDENGVRIWKKYGWNLVLPDIATYNIEDYYIFYRYVDGVDGDTINSILDLSNTYTQCDVPNIDIHNLSQTDWEQIKRLYILQVLLSNLQLKYTNQTTQ